MIRVRTRLGAALATVALGASALAVTGGVAHALSNPASPQLAFAKTITTHPFANAGIGGINAGDVEGLAYVPTNLSGPSLWVADDNRDRLFETDQATGGLKYQLKGSSNGTDFEAATNAGSDPALAGKTCQQVMDPSIKDGPDPTGTSIDTGAFECLSRTDDFESVIYDQTNDVMYATSGNCCVAGLPITDANAVPPTEVWVNGQKQPQGHGYPYHPTVWKLTRNGSGNFVPTSWQALPEGEDPTAAGITPAGQLWFGHNTSIHTYDFATNTLGSDKSLSGVSNDVVGIAFAPTPMAPSADATAFITTATPMTANHNRTTADSDSTIQRFDITGSTWSSNSAWKFPLKSIGNPALGVQNAGMIDARDTAIIGDSFYVSDGYDYRTDPDPSKSGDHPIYVYNLTTAPPPGIWRFESLNSSSHFVNGNSLLKYGSQIQDFYADASHGTLAHSWWDGARWNVETLDGAGRNTPDLVGTVVASMQYGTQIQLFYLDATAHSLRHAWWDGARWNFETLDGLGGANGRTTHHVAGGTIAIRQLGGQVQIFYSDDIAHTLRHAWWDGTKWNFENFDASTTLPGGVYLSSTQLGTTFHVAYKTAAGTLRHAWYNGSWNFQTLDGSGGQSGHTNDNVGDFVQLTTFGSQLDAVYQDATTSAVRHAFSSNGTSGWTFEALDGSGGSISGHTSNHVGASIAVLPFGGALHLVYQDLTTGALRHAWYDGVWHVEILDGTGGVAGSTGSTSTGFFNSMIDYGGQIQLTYFDHAHGDRLEHAWFG